MSYAVRERLGQGWLVFAALVLVIAGIMRVLDAVWAFQKSSQLTQQLQVIVWDDSLSAYGWLWLIVGILLIVAGLAVMTGTDAGLWSGIVMAAIAAISSFLWIYVFPIWSLVGVALAFLAIYGLVTYRLTGAEIPDRPDLGGTQGPETSRPD